MGEPEIGAISGRVGMYVTCVLYLLGDHLMERLVSFFHYHHYHFSFNADTLGALRDPGLRRKLTAQHTTRNYYIATTRAVNPPCHQILRTDREGMIHDVISHNK